MICICIFCAEKFLTTEEFLPVCPICKNKHNLLNSFNANSFQSAYPINYEHLNDISSHPSSNSTDIDLLLEAFLDDSSLSSPIDDSSIMDDSLSTSPMDDSLSTSPQTSLTLPEDSLRNSDQSTLPSFHLLSPLNLPPSRICKISITKMDKLLSIAEEDCFVSTLNPTPPSDLHCYETLDDFIPPPIHTIADCWAYLSKN